MNRKKTNEKIAEFIKDSANKIRAELEKDFAYTQRLLFDAETKLLNGLTIEQKQLYVDILKYQKECLRIKKDLGEY